MEANDHHLKVDVENASLAHNESFVKGALPEAERLQIVYRDLQYTVSEVLNGRLGRLSLVPFPFLSGASPIKGQGSKREGTQSYSEGMHWRHSAR